MKPQKSVKPAKSAKPSSTPKAPKKRGAKKGRRKKALQQVDPHRMCIVCRASKPNDELLRFARAPDGAIGFDIKAVLPGRGAWVCATVACLDKATEAKHGGFARAFEEAVVFDGAVVKDTVRRLLVGEVLSRLGLLRRQGSLIVGRDDVIRQVERLAFVGIAADLSANSRKEVSEAWKSLPTPPTTLPLPPMADLADALGTRAVGVVGVANNAHADGLAVAIHKAVGTGAITAVDVAAPPVTSSSPGG